VPAVQAPREEVVRARFGDVVTRFAPSPTGDLHLGGAWTALASWVWARREGGTALLRVEDLDRPRVVPGAEVRILEDLAWLGLRWDEPVLRQSERDDAYERAIAHLSAAGLVYPCDCSRAEIARAASAPHAGEEGREMAYPGTCRDLDPGRPMKRPPSIRFRVPDEEIAYVDAIAGRVAQHLSRDVGDFVLKRGDGVFAYQLAVVVDDLATNVTDVVRGADLVASTPRQIALARALGAVPPAYAHVPLVVGADGARLEKRTRGITLRELRHAGVSAERVIGELAHGLGLAPTAAPAPAASIAQSLRDDARPIAWRRAPWPIPAALLSVRTPR
jgi:glutamyl-tRNA synthetase